VSGQINLYNPALGKKKLTWSALFMIKTVGVVGLGLLGFTVYLHQRTAKMEIQLAGSQTQLAAAQTNLAKMNAELLPRVTNKQLESEIAQAEVELREMDQVSLLIKKGNFGSANGYSTFLQAFARQSLDGLWLTHLSVAENGKEIGLRGRALQADMVPQYIQRLSQESALKGKSFARLEIDLLDDPGSDVVKFTLQARNTTEVVNK
jgi:hypothetical protein